MSSQDPGPQGPGHNLRLNCGKIKTSNKHQATSTKHQAPSDKQQAAEGRAQPEVVF